MAMGRTTFEWVYAHERLDEEPEKWRRWYGDTPCWVFTHRDHPVVPDADIRFRCTYDCSWELVATRTTTGAVAARVRGHGRYGRTLVASLKGRKLGRAPLRLSLTVVHPVNPGVPFTRASGELRPA